MGAALQLVQRSSAALPTAPAPIDPVRLLPDWARMEAEQSLALIRPALARMQQGVSRKAAAKWLASTADGLPSWSTIDRWLQQYSLGGLVALAPQYKGRARKEHGWEARALQLYNTPQKPAYSTVAYWLRQEGHPSAAEHLVRRYLKAAPSNVTETGRKRLGAHYYNQNIKPYVIRDHSVLPVGFMYEGDGHCCDVYVAHPNTGHAFRPELTTWIDVRSHYLVSWWMSEAESAQTTLFSLSDALVSHQHVPAYVHTDPGSGFKAKLISDEVTGFLARFSITPMLALPGNAKGKGLQEGWFRWFEERCGRRFNTFCGDDRTDDYLRHLRQKVKAGTTVLPTLQQYRDAVRDYIHAYNNNPQDGLGGQTPAQLWAGLERTPLETPAEAVIRPRKACTVQRWGVRLDNRWYRANTLAEFETRKVIVEYSLHDDEHVACFALDGRFITDAQLVQKKAFLPASRIEEGQRTRLEGQRQRKLYDIAEQEARARTPISSAADMLDALEAPQQIVLPASEPSPLELGHSVGTVATPKAAPPKSRAPRADTAARVAAVMADSDIARETSHQRYQRWLDAQVGGVLAPELLAWVRSYETTHEFSSFERLRNQFGAVSGVDIPPAFQTL